MDWSNKITANGKDYYYYASPISEGSKLEMEQNAHSEGRQTIVMLHKKGNTKIYVVYATGKPAWY